MRVRLTPRGHGVVLIGAGLVAAGAVAGPSFGGLGLLGWGAGLLAFTVLYRALFAVRAAALASAGAVRELRSPPGDGEAFAVRLTVCAGLLGGLDVEVVDGPPRGLVAVDEPRGRAVVPPGGCGWVEYRLRGRPGRHRWGRARLVLRDWLGLFEVEASTEPRGVSAVSIAPRLLGGLARRVLAAAAGYSAALSSAKPGRGTVFLELREYRPDDDSRLIDWKSYARTGKLMVKVFEAEEAGRVLIVADLCGGSWGVAGHTLGEAVARAAYTLAWLSSMRGSSVAVAAEPVGASTGYLRGRRAVVAAARLLSGLEYPASGLGPAECRCKPRVPRPGRGVRLVYVTGLCGGDTGYAEELAGALPPGSLVAVVAPRPPGGAGLAARAYRLASARIGAAAEALRGRGLRFLLLAGREARGLEALAMSP